MITQIIINRKSEWINRARGYKILIDGTEVRKLANGGSEEFIVAPGIDKVQCKTNWCSSPELELELKEGDTKSLSAVFLLP